MKKLPEKDLLRPDEVANYFSVTKMTIYRWVDEGRLECTKISNSMRIFRESVVDLIRSCNIR